MDRTFSFLSNYFGPSCLSTQAPSSAGERAAPSFLCLMQASAFTELNYKVWLTEVAELAPSGQGVLLWGGAGDFFPIQSINPRAGQSLAQACGEGPLGPLLPPSFFPSPPSFSSPEPKLPCWDPLRASRAVDEMVRWLQPSCYHGNQAACQTHSLGADPAFLL